MEKHESSSEMSPRSKRLRSRVERAALIIILFGLPLNTFSQTPEEAFSKGNELYRRGQFQEALRAYESILSQGYVSSELYFNMGNVYFRLNKIARAILSYERASRLRPGDPDVENNLKLAQLKTADRIDPVPELFVFSWLRALGSIISREIATAGFIVSWLLLFLSLSVLSVLKRLSFLSATRRIAVVAVVGVVVLGSFMGIHAWERSAGRDQAVILAPVVTAKFSPDEQGADAFVIHEGLKVRMSDSVADWEKITLPDGKVGWIRSEHCEKI